MTAAATGRLIQKIQRQLAKSTITPDSTTPVVPPKPASPPQIDRALAFSLESVNSRAMIDRAAGPASASPMPWRARDPMSITWS